jgi:hypothetical protein
MLPSMLFPPACSAALKATVGTLSEPCESCCHVDQTRVTTVGLAPSRRGATLKERRARAAVLTTAWAQLRMQKSAMAGPCARCMES